MSQYRAWFTTPPSAAGVAHIPLIPAQGGIQKSEAFQGLDLAFAG
jgi:hypothetical protein